MIAFYNKHKFMIQKLVLVFSWVTMISVLLFCQGDEVAESIIEGGVALRGVHLGIIGRAVFIFVCILLSLQIFFTSTIDGENGFEIQLAVTMVAIMVYVLFFSGGELTFNDCAAANHYVISSPILLIMPVFILCLGKNVQCYKRSIVFLTVAISLLAFVIGLKIYNAAWLYYATVSIQMAMAFRGKPDNGGVTDFDVNRRKRAWIGFCIGYIGLSLAQYCMGGSIAYDFHTTHLGDEFHEWLFRIGFVLEVIAVPYGVFLLRRAKNVLDRNERLFAIALYCMLWFSWLFSTVNVDNLLFPLDIAITCFFPYCLTCFFVMMAFLSDLIGRKSSCLFIIICNIAVISIEKYAIANGGVMRYENIVTQIITCGIVFSIPFLKTLERK